MSFYKSFTTTINISLHFHNTCHNQKNKYTTKPKHQKPKTPQNHNQTKLSTITGPTHHAHHHQHQPKSSSTTTINTGPKHHFHHHHQPKSLSTTTITSPNHHPPPPSPAQIIIHHHHHRPKSSSTTTITSPNHHPPPPSPAQIMIPTTITGPIHHPHHHHRPQKQVSNGLQAEHEYSTGAGVGEVQRPIAGHHLIPLQTPHGHQSTHLFPILPLFIFNFPSFNFFSFFNFPS